MKKIFFVFGITLFSQTTFLFAGTNTFTPAVTVAINNLPGPQFRVIYLGPAETPFTGSRGEIFENVIAIVTQPLDKRLLVLVDNDAVKTKSLFIKEIKNGCWVQIMGNVVGDISAAFDSENVVAIIADGTVTMLRVDVFVEK